MPRPKNLLVAALLFCPALPLAAQEPWDAYFKLAAGTMGGAEENMVGQNKCYGLALGGAYPLTLRGHGAVEFGYRIFPTTSVSGGYTTVDDLSDIYYACAMYRHEIWRNGVYVQGGVRGGNTKTIRDVIRRGVGVGGRDERTRLKGPRETNFGWCLGAGFRLTDLWSAELGLSNATFNNLEGASVGGVVIEVALCIHR
jgi:hypothetical protein